MQGTANLRERKKARTRDAIVRVALELFEEQGFEATTVDQIAQEAEVGRRTFFRYFPTKEAVIYPRHEEQLARFRELLDDGEPGLGPFDRVRRAFLALAEDLTRDRDEMLVQQRVIEASPALIAHDRRLDLAWEAAIARALADPQPPDHHARVLAGAIMGVVRATLRDWFAGDARGDLVALGTEALDLLEQGVAHHGQRPDARPRNRTTTIRPKEERR